jgi:MFS superfamily sulfate permease-like transporter
LGHLPYTDIFLDIHQHRAAKEFSGVKILQFSSPLFFLNRELFQESVYKKVLGGQKFRSGEEGNEFGNVTSIILDCSAMSFIDSAGVEAIIEVANDLQKRHRIDVALAACPPPVLSMLTKTNFFDKSPCTAIFPSVQEATHRMEESPKLKKKTMQIHFEGDEEEASTSSGSRTTVATEVCTKEL